MLHMCFSIFVNLCNHNIVHIVQRGYVLLSAQKLFSHSVFFFQVFGPVSVSAVPEKCCISQVPVILDAGKIRLQCVYMLSKLVIHSVKLVSGDLMNFER